MFTRPRGGQPTATHTFDPHAYLEALCEQAHAWEDCHRNDDLSVTGETGR